MKNIGKIFVCLCAFSFSLQAIEGSYNIKAEDVPGSHDYCTGTLEIVKDKNDVYQFTWNVLEEGVQKVYLGTGLKEDRSLSLVFQEALDGKAKCGGSEGIQIYHMEGDTLKGPYVYLGKSQIGMEEAVKIKSKK